MSDSSNPQLGRFLAANIRRQLTVLPVAGVQPKPSEAGIFRSSWFPTVLEPDRPSQTVTKQPSLMDLYRQIEEQS